MHPHTAHDALHEALDSLATLQDLMHEASTHEGGSSRIDPFQAYQVAHVSPTGTSLVWPEGSAKRDRQDGPVGVFVTDTNSSAHAQLAFQKTVAAWRRDAKPLAHRLHDSIEALLSSILPQGTGRPGATHTVACNAVVTHRHAAIGLVWQPSEEPILFKQRNANVPLPQARGALRLAIASIRGLATTPHEPLWPRYTLHISGRLGKKGEHVTVQAANPAMAVLSVAASGLNILFVPGAHTVEITQTLTVPGTYDDPHALLDKAFG